VAEDKSAIQAHFALLERKVAELRRVDLALLRCRRFGSVDELPLMLGIKHRLSGVGAVVPQLLQGLH
jgi:hypothetical protein